MRRIGILSPLLGVAIWYIFPSFYLGNGTIDLYTYLIWIILTFYLGYSLGNKFSIKYYRISLTQRSFNRVFLLFSLLTYLGVSLMIQNYGGLNSLLSGNARNYYYQNQFQLSTNRFVIAKYVGILFTVYVIYGGIYWDRMTSILRRGFVIALFLISYLKWALGSRLFILYILFLMGRSYRYKFTGFQKITVLVLVIIGVTLGVAMRYGTYNSSDILSIFRSTENLNYVLSLESPISISAFIYDLSFIPTNYFDYKIPNLTLLKYGALNGSSEPMPVLASMYYGMKNWSAVYMMILGYFAGMAFKNYSKDSLFFLYMCALTYVFLLYLTHSSFRATNRLAILCIHIQLFNFFLGGICRKAT